MMSDQSQREREEGENSSFFLPNLGGDREGGAAGFPVEGTQAGLPIRGGGLATKDLNQYPAASQCAADAGHSMGATLPGG